MVAPVKLILAMLVCVISAGALAQDLRAVPREPSGSGGGLPSEAGGERSIDADRAGIAAAESPNASEAADACRASALPHALEEVPGEVAATRLVTHERERKVEFDNETVLLAASLQSVLEERVTLRDVASFEEQSLRVCVFEIRSLLDRGGALPSLALGAGADVSPFRLAANVTLVVIEETFETRRVEIDRSSVLAALAFSNHDANITFEDVASIKETKRTVRTVEHAVEVDDENAIVALALARHAGAHNNMATEVTDQSRVGMEA